MVEITKMNITWNQTRAYQQELEENCRIELPFREMQGCGILVTGANGLIGSYLIDTFLKMNDVLQLELSITALCRSKEKAERRFADYLDRKDFELLLGDICRQDILSSSKFRNRWAYIIHAAGHAHPRAFATQPVETMKANLLGTMNLLEEIKARTVKYPIRRLLLLSSGEIYGESIPEDGNGWHENEAGTVNSMKLRSCYPEGKRAAETLCVSYVREYDISAVVARLSYIYGAPMQWENTRADIQFFSSALKGEPIIMKSSGEQYRSYCYLQDAAKGLLYLLLKGKAGEAYNVANMHSNVMIRELAEMIAEVFGVQIFHEKPGETERMGYSQMKRETLNSEKLMALGWKPERNLRDGVEQVCRIWQYVWKENG